MTEGRTPHEHHDPSIDQKLALRTAARRLEREFDGVPDETVDQCLLSAYDHVAGHATIDNFLPLLAERYTREWLHAMTEDESTNGSVPRHAVSPARRRR
ncbi:three-helix bundle dimerization domain-containing protein [Nocardia sp. CA-119907]|uniref:three-helix bundle dimerization domain-containing protein n=1 Tax=Nocardia sp. CA-119907 TaxID=3239973 RepID=UPI003D99F519